MLRLTRMMYLRPGNLYKDFIVKRKIDNIKSNGRQIDEYQCLTKPVCGILAEATQYQNEQYKHRWDQEQHSLTHTIVSSGSPYAKEGDRLIYDSRVFEVLTVDDVGGLGITTIYYAEERNDVK